MLPRDLAVAGLLLDEKTGALNPVVRPGEDARPGPASETAGAEEAPAEEAPPRSETAKREDPRIRESARMLVRSIVGTAELRGEAKRIREEMSRRSNPLTKIGLLKGFLAQAASQSREVRGHLDALLAETGESHTPSREEILEIVRALLDEVEP
jgi:hypothetical protein